MTRASPGAIVIETLRVEWRARARGNGQYRSETDDGGCLPRNLLEIVARYGRNIQLTVYHTRYAGTWTFMSVAEGIFCRTTTVQCQVSPRYRARGFPRRSSTRPSTHARWSHDHRRGDATVSTRYRRVGSPTRQIKRIF